MDIIIYNSGYKKIWDDFVKNSKNGTFLFYRDYMEYHSDRFRDHSLMFFDNNKLIALLPANIDNGVLYSHNGLTYGGFVFNNDINCDKVLDCFKHLLDYLKSSNITQIVYKSIPHIYHKEPSEEDRYALFINDFSLLKREPSVSIQFSKWKFPANKIRGYKKAIREGLNLAETDNSSLILEIANNNLIKKYNVKAVHKPEEMNYLKSKFPNNILILEIKLNNTIIGGGIFYISNSVVHAQYLALNDLCRKLRGMDFILYSIYEKFHKEYEWFDFGISSEKGGRFLNVPLMRQKEEFGGGTVCYDTYIKKI